MSKPAKIIYIAFVIQQIIKIVFNASQLIIGKFLSGTAEVAINS